MRAPRTMPGKKPAAKDLPSKPCWVWTAGGASVVCDADGASVTEGEGDDVGNVVEEAVEEVGGEDRFLSTMHVSPLHL